MCKLIVENKRWTIEKCGKFDLLGIGTPTQAALIAKRLGVILTEFEDLNKRAA